MTVIIDYGAGNVQSVLNAFKKLNFPVMLTSDPNLLKTADAAIMPGVGSFGDAMDNLRQRGFEEPIKEFIKSGKPFLGICVGLQALFEDSEESPGVKGLGILKGNILKIPQNIGEDGKPLKIPHMGWNSLEITRNSVLFPNACDNPYFYFVHSYYLKAKEDIVTATAHYGIKIDAAVQKDNVFACQFHPEKSGEEGLNMLKKFIAYIGG